MLRIFLTSIGELVLLKAACTSNGPLEHPSLPTTPGKRVDIESPDGNGCGGHNCEGTYVDLGKKTWWAQIKLKSGQTAWVLMDDSPFGGVDAPA